MTTMFNIEITKKGAIYVNGTLIRTRNLKRGDSNHVAAEKIIKRLSEEIVQTGQHFFVYLSDEPGVLADSVELNRTKRVIFTNLSANDDFTLYDRVPPPTGAYRYILMPCVKWFKKFTGIMPPEKLWLKIETILP